MPEKPVLDPERCRQVLARRLVLNDHIASLAISDDPKRARGLLVMAGDFGPGIGASGMRRELLWPATVQCLAQTIDEIGNEQEQHRQDWFQWEGSVQGRSIRQGLFEPSALLLWYFEFDVLELLGVSADHAIAATDAQSDLWNKTLDSIERTIPPFLSWLDRPAEHTARLIMHVLLLMEQAGTSHGRCFLRTLANCSASPALNSTTRSKSNSGVTS